MFEEASGKKFILCEWDGNNNKVELNQRSVKEISFDLHQTGSILWMTGRVKSYFWTS